MKKLYIYLLFNFIAIFALGQDSKPGIMKSVEIKEYLTDVFQGNLGYIAEQFNLDMAEAVLMAARVYTDPGIAVGYSDNQNKRMQLGRGVDAGISYDFNLGNIRAARIGVASTEKNLAGLVLQKYFQDLRADASLVFYNSLKYRLLADVREDNYQRMKELAWADSIRLLTGTIMEVDARQSNIEARVQKNEAIRAVAAWKMALVQVSRLTGSVRTDTTYRPIGSLELPLKAVSCRKSWSGLLKPTVPLNWALKPACRTTRRQLMR